MVAAPGAGATASIFPTDRPSAPTRERDGVPDRPTLSATGHGSRPDSGDPTDRLFHAVSLPPGRVGPADRPTLSEAARACEVYCTFNFASPFTKSIVLHARPRKFSRGLRPRAPAKKAVCSSTT